MLKAAEFTIARDKRQNAALVEILDEIQRLMKLDDRGTQGPNTRLTNALNTLVNIRNLATDAMGGGT